jgi:Cd2+/Zn2+-exporting ATPase
MKYKYKLSGLNCANCAHKIECKLNEHKDIDNANVNFSKLTVSVTTNSKADIKDIVTKVSKEIEPDVVVLDIDENVKDKIYLDIIKIVVGLLLGILGGFVLKGTIAKIMIILAYIILLSKVFLKAIKQIRNLIIDENLLITISCVGAYLTNNIHEGLMVIVLYDIGKVLESIAVNNSRKSIKELMNIKPEYASVLKDNEYIKVNPEEVKICDTIRILTGEKIPLDGIILKGTAKIDNSSLTGESKLVKVSAGDKVLSGSICTEGILEIKVTITYENSTVARILDVV